MPNTNRPRISVILPTYNERENISELMGELSFYISKYIGDDFELLVVDDDSPDKTWQEAERYSEIDHRIRLIHRTGQRSLALAISEGIREAKGGIIAWMDCDFSMPTYRLVELIKKVFEGYDVAVGSRFVKGGKDVRGPADSWSIVILSRLMNSFISFVLGASFKDYTSGFVAVRRTIFDNGIKINGNYGEYFIDFIYNSRKRGYKIIELPYYCLPRRRGYSKTGSNLWDYLRIGWVYVLFTLKLRLNLNKWSPP
ncbi:MAG: glycosyltransferase [Candidatus Omnitrophica bacterium]|nr:glycosyltransferase [Candidatus Omnitrophota bacterium]